MFNSCSQTCGSQDVGHSKILRRRLNVEESASAAHERMCCSPTSQELLIAATFGDVPRLAAALDAHGDPNACDADGLSPLTLASAGGHVQSVILLLEARAMPDSNPHAQGLSALVVAAAQGNMEVLKALLRAAANPAQGAKKGTAPLMRAAAAGHVDVCTILIEGSAPVDACDRSGTSPLMLAAEKGRAQVVMLLLSRKASANRLDVHNRCTLMRAVDILLRKNPQKCNLTPFWAPIDHWFLLCRELVEHAADPNIVNGVGETLLARAVRHQRKDITEFLLDVGAVPDLPVPILQNGSVLLLAARAGSFKLCKVLIERLASVNICDCQGDNALSLAASHGHERVAMLLMDHGAKPLQRTSDGQPLIVRAAESGCKQLYNRLLIHGHVQAVKIKSCKGAMRLETP